MFLKNITDFGVTRSNHIIFSDYPSGFIVIVPPRSQRYYVFFAKHKTVFAAVIIHHADRFYIWAYCLTFVGTRIKAIFLACFALYRIQYAFVHSASFPESVMSEELLREPFVLCMPSTHRAAGQPNVRLADFAQESFVLFSRVFSPTYYDQVVSICVGAGFHPEIRHEARHWLTVLALVSKGMGVTLVPRGLASYKLATLAFAEIEPSPVRSLVRGAWLASEAAEPALMAWHQAVLRTVVKKEG